MILQFLENSPTGRASLTLEDMLHEKVKDKNGLQALTVVKCAITLFASN